MAVQTHKTVACRLSKLIPDERTVSDVRMAVSLVHEVTIQATSLLNLHIRSCIANDNLMSSKFFDRNWILKAFQEVTVCKTGKVCARDLELAQTMTHMPDFTPVDRSGLTQLFLSNATLIASNAKNNIWMHFNRRLLAYVKRQLEIPKQEYDALTKAEKTARMIQLNRIATDIRRMPSDAITSSIEYHAFVELQREILRIDISVGNWNDKPLLYHLKTKPHAFLKATSLMSHCNEDSGRSGFSLYPLRRSMVPGFIRFDADSLNKALQLLQNRRLGRKRRPKAEEEFTFTNTVDYRAAGIKQRWRIDDGFSTDGMSVRVQQFLGDAATVQKLRCKKREVAEKKAEGRKRKRNDEPMAEKSQKEKPSKSNSVLTKMPERGIWAIDELKRISRLESLHVVGIDPGKRELIAATDSDDPKSCIIRYTIAQRQKDMRSRQYANEGRRDKPTGVHDAERNLSDHNSRTADFETFKGYIRARQAHLMECLKFYGEMHHRHRRWKTFIKRQKSEELLYKRLKSFKTDERPLVLAYGSWGTIAGTKSACNKGNPSCIGVGLMRKIAKRFVVAITPEAYTSKTCHECLGTCGPHPTMRSMRNKREIRGLRVCQDPNCNRLLNRDANASRNIGLQFKLLFEDKGTIRSLSALELEMTKHRMCLECAMED